MRQQEKMAAQEIRIKERKRTSIVMILAVVAPLLLVAVLVAFALMTRQPKEDIPDVGEAITIQGREHIKVGVSHGEYNSNPPTSGWHYEVPAEWGVYTKELPQEQLIHNLEHGGIVIQYKPTLDKETIAQLEDLKKSEFECKLVVAPYNNLDTHINIALTAWGRLHESAEYNETDIKNFIKKYKDTGPEFVPCSASAAPMQQGQ